MATTNLGDFLRRLTRGMAAETLADHSDQQLVETALAGCGEASFQAIVHRHGPMVYRVCWRVLQHQQNAEDAFQATFLILAQKLRTVRKHASLASWLHGVAHRVALKAKAQSAARRWHEHRASPSETLPADDVTWGEFCLAFDSELNQLPDKWRLPLILCYLEGRTQEDSASELGWSKSTLRRRLDEARTALGARLAGRGIAWSAAISAVLFSDCIASAAPAPVLIASTVEAAAGVAAGKTVATAASATVATLTEGMLKAMLLTKLKTVATVLLVVSLIAFGGGLLTHQMAAGQQVNVRQEGERPANRNADAPATNAHPVSQKGETGRKADKVLLQGAWKLTAQVVGGEEVKDADKKGGLLYVNDDELRIKQGAKLSEPLRYTLDESQKPKAIDLVVANGKILKGIYELDGDGLKLCMPLEFGKREERPTKFLSEQDSDLILFTFRRDPKAPKLDPKGIKASDEGRSARQASAKNLARIGLALHDYEQAKETFRPAAIYNKDGKPLLSWRVAILPYIGHEDLYKEFKLDEPWDSKHNKKLLERMPEIYGPQGSETYYLAFTGMGTVLEGKDGVKRVDITDGAANTIVIAEAAKAVSWTKPEELEYHADKALPKLGGLFKDGFNVLTAAGDVHFVEARFNEKAMRALITRNDGASVDFIDLDKK